MISREVRSIVDYVESTGLLYRVTDIGGPGHADGSYHYAKGTDGDGLAVDFGGVTPGVTPTTAAQMAAIHGAFLMVSSRLAELIHSGSGIKMAVKNGQLVKGASFFGPVTWPDHRDHVHVAVPRGTFLASLSQPLGTVGGGQMPDSPDLANITGPVSFHPIVDSSGLMTGYVIFSTATGEVHTFGQDGKVPYYGRSEVT